MNKKPTMAFILAAGIGSRLRPYTDTVPKPMVKIAGKPIIDRTIEKLAAEGVSTIVINTHHLAPVLEKHLKTITTPTIILSHETELLETGGGIKRALHHFQNNPFYIINGDALWDDTSDTALNTLAAQWDSHQMDILLLLQPVAKMTEGGAVGDYTILKDGRARRARDKTGDYMFAGIRIAHPRIFTDSPSGPFSFLTLMDRAEQEGRLFATPHASNWYHISTPEDYATINTVFEKREQI